MTANAACSPFSQKIVVHLKSSTFWHQWVNETFTNGDVDANWKKYASEINVVGINKLHMHSGIMITQFKKFFSDGNGWYSNVNMYPIYL